MNAKTSYLSLTQAQIYFDGILSTEAWDSASPGDKLKALVQASSDVDKLAYASQKSELQQEHEFPRFISDYTIESNKYDTDLIPLDIKYAVCEQALAILDGWDVAQEIDGLSTTSSSYSGVKSDFDRDRPPMHLLAGLCPKAWQFVLPFIRDTRSIVLRRV